MTGPEKVDIDLNQCDPAFKDAVARLRGAEHIARCYACGACSARCPVGERRAEFDPRRLIRLVMLGQRQMVLESPLLWLCSTCFTCQETCPQGVGFTEVLFALKNLASDQGHLPGPMTAQADLLRDHGRLYEITEFENKKRAELGLPDLEERPSDYAELLKGFHPRVEGKE